MNAIETTSARTRVHRCTRTLQLALLSVLFVAALACSGGGSGGGDDDESDARPVANAGIDAIVSPGSTVTLDGTASSDEDGDALAYGWTLSEIPAGSTATLADANSAMPTFVADLAGHYEARLVVNDGNRDSEPDDVEIDAKNTAPVANAGIDQLVDVGAQVTLSGTLSSDADGDSLTYSWSLTSRPVASVAVLSNPAAISPVFTADRAGVYVARLIVNDGMIASPPDTISITTRNRVPLANAGPDQAANVGATVTLSGVASSDPDGDDLTFAWTLTGRPMGSAAQLSGANEMVATFVPDLAGPYVASLVVNDGTTNSPSDVASVTVTYTPPLDSDNDGLTDDQEAMLGSNPNDPDSDDDGLLDGAEVNTHGTSPIDADTDNDGYDDKAEIDAGSNPLDPGSVPDGSLPPDPEDIAPPLGESEISTTKEAFAFLYSGDDPIQTDVDETIFDEHRLAVVRGKVMTQQGSALAGVVVTVSGHPEFGSTRSRANGMWDLAVNGGGEFVIDYHKAGYLRVQRRIPVAWNAFTVADDVALSALDPAVTNVTLDGTSPMQAAMGSMMTDDDGSRQAAILFPQGTTATYTLPNGAPIPLQQLSVRATEFTVGANGPAAMPGELPSASAYTYAVDLSVDEAMAAGATRVDFSEPLPMYVDNFLGFPAGMIVPTGYYDYAAAAWVASPNGVVIQILSEAGGLAAVDVAGDGQAANAAALEAIGMTDAERAELAAMYEPGQSLWRMRISHFTPYDCNWPFGFGSPPDSPPGPNNGNGNNNNNGNGDDDDRDNENDCGEKGSIISCQTQSVGEVIPIVGSEFALHYESGRMLGRSDAYRHRVTITESESPAGLAAIKLDIRIAGRHFEELFEPLPDQDYEFVWDGLDAYGRTVLGESLASVDLSYGYEMVYLSPAAQAESFALYGEPNVGEFLPGGRALGIVNTHFNVAMGRLRLAPVNLGGWTLTPHHFYDAASGEMLQGDGRWRRATESTLPAQLIDWFAGNFVYASTGDGGPATQASLRNPTAVAVAADGTVYIADPVSRVVRRVAPDGIISTFAGNGIAGDSGDGGPAVDAMLSYPRSLAVASDSSLYIADVGLVGGTSKVRRVGSDGIIETVAGGGTEPLFNSSGSNDRVLATDVFIRQIQKMQLDPDGRLVFNVSTTEYARLDPDGFLTPFRPPTLPSFAWDFDEDGGFITVSRGQNQQGYVSRIAPDGQREILAPYTGGQRLRAITRSNSGRIFFSEDKAIFEVIDGESVRVAGTDDIPVNNVIGNGGPAILASFFLINDLAFGPDGGLYVSDFDGRGVRKIGSVDPLDSTALGLADGTIGIASQDGTEVYAFDESGLHLQTHNALTGAILYSFDYSFDDDGEGRLSTITDGDARVTTIERDADGRATAIVAPGGQTTILTLNTDGYLETVTNPASESTTLSYANGGLISRFERPSGDASQYVYDVEGRLDRAEDAAGGFQQFTRVSDDETNTVTVTRTTALGRATTYASQNLPDGSSRETITHPDGRIVVTTNNPDGTATTSNSDGTNMTLRTGPDPRFGAMSTVLESLVTTTPGGLVSTLEQSRIYALADPNDPFSVTSIEETVDANGRVYTYAYDAAIRALTLTTPEGHERLSMIDELGRIVSLTPTDAADPETSVYDAQGRIVEVSRGDESIAYTYDALNRIISRMDAAGNVALYAYDDADRVVEITLPDDETVSFTYDANGNRTSVEMPNGNTHSQDWSALDRLADYTPPGGLGFSQTYDFDRALSLRTQASGAVIENEFNTQGQWVGIHYPEADVQFTYDGLGDRIVNHVRMPVEGGAAQTVSHGYDGRLVTSKSFSGLANGSFFYEYDNNFFLTSIEYLSGADTGTDIVTRDLDGMVTGHGPYTFTRGGMGGALSEISDGTFSQIYEYDSVGRVRARAQTVNGTAILSMSVARDNVGRIVNRTETIAGVTHLYAYSYDSVGQLVGVTRDASLVESYGYDANGNRTSTLTASASYDAQDRLSAHAGVVYTFDADGFLASRGGDAFTYSALGELLSATVDGNTIDYGYDALRRRVSRSDASGTTTYLYGSPSNPFLVTAVRDDAGGLTLYDYDLAGFLHAFRRGANTYYVGTDQVGTPLVVSNASGTVVKQLEYDSFGRRTNDSNPTFELPFGFAGGIEDVDTGLVRFGYRDYDQESGRWLARDPVLYSGGQSNLYAYVGNNPVAMRDPLGLWCVGASFYEVAGGGGEICYDSDNGGFSACAEFGLGFGGDVNINSSGAKKNEDIAEVSGGVNCGPLKLGFKCKKSTRCGGVQCTPTAGLGNFELDGEGEAKASIPGGGGDDGKKSKKCGVQGTVKVISCLNEP